MAINLSRQPECPSCKQRNGTGFIATENEGVAGKGVYCIMCDSEYIVEGEELKKLEPYEKKVRLGKLDAVKEAILEDCKRLTVTELSLKYSISQPVIYEMLSKYNLSPPQIKEAKRREVIKLKMQKKDARQIAKILNIKTAQVYNFVRVARKKGEIK